jgi:DNA-binding transcriptional LysR family regulator
MRSNHALSAQAPAWQLDDLRLIQALAQQASLSAAARSLHVTPPALSMRLKRLEQQLGTTLASRAARQLSLTREGHWLAQQAQEILQRLEALPDGLQRRGQEMAGPLRVSAPFGFGRQHVAPALAQFVKMHPGIQPTLNLLEAPWPDRQQADLVIHIGSVRDSSSVAHLLARNERWVCASPAYLRSHATPLKPDDLAQHATVCLRENDEDETLWHYARALPASRDAVRASARRDRVLAHSVRVQPALVSNDGEVVRNWAQAGLGVALRSQWDVQAAIAQGKLVRLLADWTFGSADIVALTPASRNTTARVQTLIAHLKASFKPA